MTDPYMGLELSLSRGKFISDDGGAATCELRIGRREGMSSNLSDADIAKALIAIQAWFNVSLGTSERHPNA